ncbi:MAG TPA: DUF4436 family protein, partial [Mycobacterium sp.]
MTVETPPAHAAPAPKKRSRLVLGVGVLIAFIVVYGLSLFGFHLLGQSAAPIKAPDLNAADDTVVLVRIEELKTVANRLGVKVLVYPQENMWDPKLEVLKSETAVRMDPPNDAGDLVYPAGKSPAMVATTVEAHGDPEIWPFDSYKTDTLSADVLVGSGDDRKYKPARVEVAGKLEGWDVGVQRVGEGNQEAGVGDSVIITLHRSKAPLIFDLGICLVLAALAALALAVVIPMATG